MKEICPFKPRLNKKSKSVRSIQQDSQLDSDQVSHSQTGDQSPPRNPTNAKRQIPTKVSKDQFTPKKQAQTSSKPSDKTKSPSRSSSRVNSLPKSRPQSPPKSPTSGRTTIAKSTRSQTAKPTRPTYTHDEVKEKRHYQAIFETLKPTNKGTLNCATITRCNLTDDQAVYLRPILEKLVTSDLEVGFEEFCQDIAKLQKLKNYPDLSKLFNTRAATPLTNISRTRLVDPSTLRMKPSEASDFYSKQVSQQSIRKQFLRSLRKSLEAGELAECTFKPKLEPQIDTQNAQ